MIRDCDILMMIRRARYVENLSALSRTFPGEPIPRELTPQQGLRPSGIVQKSFVRWHVTAIPRVTPTSGLTAFCGEPLTSTRPLMPFSGTRTPCLLSEARANKPPRISKETFSKGLKRCELRRKQVERQPGLFILLLDFILGLRLGCGADGPLGLAVRF